MGKNPYVRQIAEVRKCNDVQARGFCLEVQRWATGAPSFKSIAQATRLLGPGASAKEVAAEAITIHGKGFELRSEPCRPRPPRRGKHKQRISSPRRRRPLRGQGGHRYILVDGVLQRYPGDIKED